MDESRKWFLKTENGQVYGPVGMASLVQWANDGRIEPSARVSTDRNSWSPVSRLPELGLHWLVEVDVGKVYGPFTKSVVRRLVADGTVAPSSRIYRLQDGGVDQATPDDVQAVEKIVEREVVCEVPVEVSAARVEVVVPEVVEPVPMMSQQRPVASQGERSGRDRLAALEAAARRELASARGRGLNIAGNIFGRK